MKMRIKSEYDVIIIGAGPAGSTFARYVAEQGLDTLVVDKRKEIGVPVRCAEGLGQRVIKDQNLHIPEKAYSAKILGAKVVGPRGQTLVWKTSNTTGWVLDRRVFDKWLAELAIDKGAKVLSHTTAKHLIKEDGEIVGVVLENNGKEQEVRAKLIVSAEGMEAHIAFQAGFNTIHNLYDVDTCYQYEVKGYEHENLIELYFGNKIAPRGYVWIFPKEDDKANVGIGIGGHLQDIEKSKGIIGADPKGYLDRFMEQHEALRDVSVLNEFGGVISVGAPLTHFVKDHFMIVGTAAKQVDPIHGGGIGLAMESAKIAAGVAVEAFREHDFSERKLKRYEEIWNKTIGDKERKRLILRKVIEKLSDDDLNHIFTTIKQDDLNDVMDGNFAHVVAKVVMGRPQLLASLKALLE
jgi:digeranylgeranylglycerophospholipid reductase